ncbi:MAG: class I SAM-dependent methyltransferase [Thermoflexales bacterium]|nr:class I SAM-dependent methyltransferase [Thermoflexales bacterium]
MGFSVPTLEQVRDFWERNPVCDRVITSRKTWYDYFHEFDKRRELAEPYEFANPIFGYEGSAGKKVLDYGCGNGYVLSQYAKNGAKVYGVDIAQRAIELSAARFRTMNLEGAFVQNDGLTIPFETGLFDIACSMGVLHHVPDPVPVIKELRRVLKPGGEIIVMMYHRNSVRYHLVYRWRKYFDPYYRGKSIQQIVNMTDGKGNPLGTVYTPRELESLLADFEGHTFFINKLGAEELLIFLPVMREAFAHMLPRRFVSFLARRVGWNLYCVAHKAG